MENAKEKYATNRDVIDVMLKMRFGKYSDKGFLMAAEKVCSHLENLGYDVSKLKTECKTKDAHSIRPFLATAIHQYIRDNLQNFDLCNGYEISTWCKELSNEEMRQKGVPSFEPLTPDEIATIVDTAKEELYTPETWSGHSFSFDYFADISETILEAGEQIGVSGKHLADIRAKALQLSDELCKGEVDRERTHDTLQSLDKEFVDLLDQLCENIEGVVLQREEEESEHESR